MVKTARSIARESRARARQHYNSWGAEKQGYETEDHARAAAVGYEREWKQTLAVYRCSVCGDWHLGHKR